MRTNCINLPKKIKKIFIFCIIFFIILHFLDKSRIDELYENIKTSKNKNNNNFNYFMYVLCKFLWTGY